MPKVSVIIPTYNMAEYVCQAINSVLSQTYEDFEIIVVNDGSTDNTIEVLKQYDKNQKVKIMHQKNKGLGCSRNVAIKNSSGEYVALLDADDFWMEDKLQKQVAILDNNRTVGLTHSNIYLFKDDIVDAKLRQTKVNVGRMSELELIKSLLFGEFFISVPSVMVRRECFTYQGLFYENLANQGCEDLNMWLRILQKYKPVYLDEPLAYYRLNKNGMTSNLAKMEKVQIYALAKTFADPDILQEIYSLKRKVFATVYYQYGCMNLMQRSYLHGFKALLFSLYYRPQIFIERLLKYFKQKRP